MRTRYEDIWNAARETAYEAALEQGATEQEAEEYADAHALEYANQIMADMADYARMTRKEQHHG